MIISSEMMSVFSMIVVGFVLLLVLICLGSLHRSIWDLSKAVDGLMDEKMKAKNEGK